MTFFAVFLFYFVAILPFLKFFLLFFFFGFGILSIDNSINISKSYSKYYYLWRIFVTIFVPLREFINFSKEKMCYYSKCPTFIFYSGLSFGIFLINIYATKIAWSFNVRLQKGQDLLVIHGKYLDDMMTFENQRILNTQNEIIKSNYSEFEMGKKKESNIIPSNNEEENK